MRNNLYTAAALAVTVAFAPACASKKYVGTEISTVNAKVDTLSTALETTQERTRENETKIVAVDVKADAAGRSATEARAAADAAASATQAVDARLSGRVDAVETAARQLVYEVTLSEDQGNFTFGGATLPSGATDRLDEMITQLKATPRRVFIEIEGHTDNVGDSAYNERLGLDRAEAVKWYFYEHHQVPLHRINVVSYGERKPAAENNTRAGRALNRRVVVRVLS